jgi:hypothetical protein
MDLLKKEVGGKSCGHAYLEVNMTLHSGLESLMIALLYVAMMLSAGTCGGAL